MVNSECVKKPIKTACYTFGEWRFLCDIEWRISFVLASKVERIVFIRTPFVIANTFFHGGHEITFQKCSASL